MGLIENQEFGQPRHVQPQAPFRLTPKEKLALLRANKNVKQKRRRRQASERILALSTLIEEML